jgi:hypothetical protein
MLRHIYHNVLASFFLHVQFGSKGLITGISIMLHFFCLYRVCMCVTANHGSCTCLRFLPRLHSLHVTTHVTTSCA